MCGLDTMLAFQRVLGVSIEGAGSWMLALYKSSLSKRLELVLLSGSRKVSYSGNFWGMSNKPSRTSSTGLPSSFGHHEA
jgi:hypothetical protein